MAAALVVPASVIVGQAITVTGTGFDNSESISVKISNQEETADVTFKVASSGGGAIDLSTVGIFVPQKGGIYTVTTADLTDAEAAEVVVATCKVFDV